MPLHSRFRAQALFLYDRMILNALYDSGAEWLSQKLRGNFQADSHLNELSRINALEQAAAALLSDADEARRHVSFAAEPELLHALM